MPGDVGDGVVHDPIGRRVTLLDKCDDACEQERDLDTSLELQARLALEVSRNIDEDHGEEPYEYAVRTRALALSNPPPLLRSLADFLERIEVGFGHAHDFTLSGVCWSFP